MSDVKLIVSINAIFRHQQAPKDMEETILRDETNKRIQAMATGLNKVIAMLLEEMMKAVTA